MAGWTPMVTLWGGDAHTAVKSLNRVTKAYHAFLHNTEIDKPTQKFIDDAFDEFEDFDLEGFYDLLPDERNGKRELHVKGALAGDRYLVSRAEPGSNYEVGLDGPRNGLADMSLNIRGEHKEGKDYESLVAGGRWGLGLGPLSYTALMKADRDLVRLVTAGEVEGQKVEPSGSARSFIKKNNPGLGSEDVDALALLYDAYPALGQALTQVGRLEDVRAAQFDGGTYHITTRMRAEPERLAEKYPAFAKHVKKLGDVLRANVRVQDDHGRDIVRLTIDSEKLLFGVECYMKDGLVVPFDGNKVYEDEPLDPLSDTLQKPKVLISARLNMLGIIVHVKGLRVDADYAVHGSYATADARITKMPLIKVEGRALGMFAPGFLDLFIPSNIQDITEKFMEVAVKGNNRKGIRVHIELGSKAEGDAGVLAIGAAAEIYESWVVKIGGGVVTDRLLMNDKAEDQAKQLAADLHDAFMRDFSRFRQGVGGSG
jgi:hypothetical protein